MQRNGGGWRVDIETLLPPSADGGRSFSNSLSFLSPKVAQMSERIVHTETYFEGSTDYTINVIKEDGQLYGQWVCQCGAKGGSSGSSSSNSEAVDAAKLNLYGHHKMTHVK